LVCTKYLNFSKTKTKKIKLIVKNPKLNLEKRTGEKYSESKIIPTKMLSQKPEKIAAKTANKNNTIGKGRKKALNIKTKNNANLKTII